VKYFHPHMSMEGLPVAHCRNKAAKREDKSLFPSSAEVQHVWCLRTQKVLMANMPPPFSKNVVSSIF
jgi:hypothetical protein